MDRGRRRRRRARLKNFLPPPEGVYKCASVYKAIESRVCCITSVYISATQFGSGRRRAVQVINEDVGIENPFQSSSHSFLSDCWKARASIGSLFQMPNAGGCE